MVNKIASMLDAIADSLEAKGFKKEAYEIDKIADVLDKPNILYYGLFFDQTEAQKLFDQKNSGELLERKIPDPHVTFAFKPKPEQIPPAELIGKTFPVRVIGIGKDANNQGYLVEIPQELEQYYHSPAPKHITLSISKTGKAVDTKNLNFKNLQAPFSVVGKFGYNDGSKWVFTLSQT